MSIEVIGHDRALLFTMRVDREVIGHDRALLSHDTRYFITSLDPSDVTPSDLQKIVRDHWQIENSLHFVKDRWWDLLLRWWHEIVMTSTALASAKSSPPSPTSPSPSCESSNPPAIPSSKPPKIFAIPPEKPSKLSD